MAHLVVVLKLLVATHEVTHSYVYFSPQSATRHIQTQVVFKHYLLKICEPKLLQKEIRGNVNVI